MNGLTWTGFGSAACPALVTLDLGKSLVSLYLASNADESCCCCVSFNGMDVVVVVSVGPGVVVGAVDVVTACCLSPWRPLATAALPPDPRLDDQLLSSCPVLGR